MLSAALSALGAFIGTFAAMQVHLQYLRRDVDRAHRRLDLIGAPSDGVHKA